MKNGGQIKKHEQAEAEDFRREMEERHQQQRVTQAAPPSQCIPILGTVAAGQPIIAEEHIEGYTYTTLNHGATYFGLRVRGDSMTASNIPDGSIVIVRQQPQVEDGELAVVLVANENATVKRYNRKGDTVILTPQSYNPAHEPQFYDLHETDVSVLGKVVQVVVDI